MVLLLQRAGQFLLHLGQFMFRHADFVAPSGGLDDAARVFRVMAVAHHVFRQPPHRAHQHPMQGDEDEGGRDQRNDDRQAQNIERKRNHGRAQGFFVNHDIDEFAGLETWRVDHPDDPPVAGRKGLERVPYPLHPVFFAQIEMFLDHRILAGIQHQLAGAAALQGNRFGLGVLQQFGRQLL